MKCANCGAEIKLGCVYCSVCGKEAQIVPDYNVEEDILKELLEEDDKTNKNASSNGKKKKSLKNSQKKKKEAEQKKKQKRQIKTKKPKNPKRKASSKIKIKRLRSLARSSQICRISSRERLRSSITSESVLQRKRQACMTTE